MADEIKGEVVEKVETEPKEESAKSFTQEEVDSLIENRLARERKKAEKEKSEAEANKGKSPETLEKEKFEKSAKEQADKVTSMSQKLVCYEMEVPKANVSKVTKLANTYIDDETDFEKAVQKVKTDFPFLFTNQTQTEEKPTTTGVKSSGNSYNADGVEAEFYKRNPQLKK